MKEEGGNSLFEKGAQNLVKGKEDYSCERECRYVLRPCHYPVENGEVQEQVWNFSLGAVVIARYRPQ